ncbi:methyltransferase domain-containing protein [Geobacter argillaceus]|jgi:uncharacterized protein YbaR (Trm112 family)|uniref:Uncharacterized protein YbaR (Trm112 family) n=1 Tax=Geobacter argillaceus TaxID=345631 RepID=A0A562WT70_9BACT|nr:methyltransferase domain-containing protein [Geobacter argillaceus]TWJ33610.1 uncharacterized protein YbaR (Trm112 family) [Geobacter argillaceus]
MKRFLLPHLICPVCLPYEYQLDLSVDCETDGDIITGSLTCKKCKRRFPIREGIAQLLPSPDSCPAGAQWRYEEAGMVDQYLWCHYRDLLGDTEECSIAALVTCLAGHVSSAFDAGCSVGRVAFEMAARSSWAVGCDLSLNFIRTARRLARDRHLTFTLPLEGNLRETFHIKLPEAWKTDNLEFVMADVLKVPFSKGTFQQMASLNLLDRVSYPLAHLYEMNRVARDQSASFLFASPFSWTTSATSEELWLGGTTAGPYKGRGLENVRSLLEGKGKVLSPPWHISRAGAITWRMRSHCNHYELIRSEFLVAAR